MNKTVKKLMSGLLAVSLAATSFTSAFAASKNSVTRVATVKEDSVIENVFLKIQPTGAVESGSSIILTIDNAEFDKAKIYEETGSVFDSLVSYQEDTEDSLVKPYEMRRISKSEAEVLLGGVSWKESNADPAPYYLIPIVAVVTNDKDVTVTIDSNETSISDGTYTIAKATSKNGNTKASVNESKVFSETLYVDTITIREDVFDTFESGEVKVRVNGGFKFVNSDIIVKGGINLTDSLSIKANISKDNTYFTFDMPKEWANTKRASSILIDGIKIEPEDEDKNYGDVKLTISGNSANITKQTITVGSRQDYGFEFEVLDDVPTIIAGRTFYEDRNLDSDDFKTATVKFAELTADTWLANRKLEFTVPEGVKIVDVDFDEVEEINNLEDSAVIANDGQTLRLNRGIELKDNRKDDDVASFEMNLYLSIDAGFTEDITLEVVGGGIEKDAIPALTIAKVITPITIDTASTTANLGYQSFEVADITINETVEGALLEDGEVIIAFDNKKFGGSELGFNDTDIEYTIDGELEISDFKVSKGEISFKVDKASYTEPSSITISNITVGTTRSVPYGSFDVKLFGDAIINNYKDNLDDLYPIKIDAVGESDNEDIYFFDTTDGYAYEDYIKIVTFTGSYNTKVAVTIGSQAIKVDDVEYDVDVAPYIQAETASTLVPLRVISVALFGDDVENADGSSKITFDADSKTATIFYQDRLIQFTAGSAYVIVDGTKIPCDNGAKAEIKDDRLYVPFRTLGSVLSVPVNWDNESRTATFN